MMYKYFLPACELSVHFLSGISGSTAVFNFDEAQFISVFFFVDLAFGDMSKNSLANTRS